MSKGRASQRGLSPVMALRDFLPHLEHDPAASKLADEGGSADDVIALMAEVRD